MSHIRDISGVIRSVLAVIAVLALMFSVTASGRAAPSAGAFVLNNYAAEGGGLFACFKRHMTQHVEAPGEKAPEKNSSNKHPCPDCCLAAHAAAAVLPERIATIGRPLPAPEPPAYRSAKSRAPEGVPPRSVNGARAPPV